MIRTLIRRTGLTAVATIAIALGIVAALVTSAELENRHLAVTTYASAQTLDATGTSFHVALNNR